MIKQTLQADHQTQSKWLASVEFAVVSIFEKKCLLKLTSTVVGYDANTCVSVDDDYVRREYTVVITSI